MEGERFEFAVSAELVGGRWTVEVSDGLGRLGSSTTPDLGWSLEAAAKILRAACDPAVANRLRAVS